MVGCMAAREIGSGGFGSIARELARVPSAELVGIEELRSLSEIDDVLRPEDVGELLASSGDPSLSQLSLAFGASDALRFPHRNESVPIARAIDGVLACAKNGGAAHSTAEGRLVALLQGIRELQKEIYTRSQERVDERTSRR